MIEIPEGVHFARGCLIRCDAASWPFASREDETIRRHWARRSTLRVFSLRVPFFS
jgi:hypothetical protein